ncbi:MAG TPA: hypothetical protein VK171_08980 [Fimbriimonas sp.]|nr:hypothetical protein [Fimbriimonas sp.]
MTVKTPWIHSPKFDLAAIIAPSLVVTAIAVIFQKQLIGLSEAPLWLWILLVLGIDVAHVYSSLFRTYFDKGEFEKRKRLYIIAPVASWVVGVAVYAFWGGETFWMLVAYFAIYHFVRQQYGFMMLFRRGETVGDWSYRVDQLAIYLATLYPLVYWHTYPRNFQWFEGFEVIRIPSTIPDLVLRAVTIGVMIAFLAKETIRFAKTKEVNAGKCLLLAATAISWTTGIIILNGDLTFTLVNIVSHGVPYMALVWIYQHKRLKKEGGSAPAFYRFFQLKYVPLYIAVLGLLAYFEEGIWDWFVWQEHGSIFGCIHFQASATALAVLVPLLTVPQVTHYILDAFIWRVNKKGSNEVRGVIG